MQAETIQAKDIQPGDVVPSNHGRLQVVSVTKRGRKAVIRFASDTPEGRDVEFTASELVTVWRRH